MGRKVTGRGRRGPKNVSTVGRGHWDGSEIRAVVTQVGDAETAAGSARSGRRAPGRVCWEAFRTSCLS